MGFFSGPGVWQPWLVFNGQSGEVEGCLGPGDLTRWKWVERTFRKRRKWPVTWPTDWEARAMKEAIAPHTCGWHLTAQIDDWFVASCTCCWILLGLHVVHWRVNKHIHVICGWNAGFKHILKTLGCQLRIWSGQTCWATCWPIPKLTLTYILSPWKFEKTSLPKVLDLDVKNKASKKGEYQQISSQGNRNMDT